LINNHTRVLSWTRQTHAMFHRIESYSRTQHIIETLLLGIGRLEATGVLAASHGSMLEDMLELVTLHDWDATRK